jgi:hypothetical protein
MFHRRAALAAVSPSACIILMHYSIVAKRSRREHMLATCRPVGHIGAAGDVAEWLKAAVC